MRSSKPTSRTFSKGEIFDKECIHIGIPTTKHAFGLALSGGGVRAATFALGVLQGLAEKVDSRGNCLLDTIDYLSSVSGGGYIASWFSQQMANIGYAATRNALRAPVDASIAIIRDYGSYLTPQRGFFSSDTWRMVAGYLVRLIPNLVFIVLTLTSVILLPYVIRDWTDSVVGTTYAPVKFYAWIWLPLLLLSLHELVSFGPWIPDSWRASGSVALIGSFVVGIPLAVWCGDESYQSGWLFLVIAALSQAGPALFGLLRLQEGTHTLRIAGAWLASSLVGWILIFLCVFTIHWMWREDLKNLSVAIAPSLFSFAYLGVCAAWTYCIPFDDEDQEFINSVWGATTSLSLLWALCTAVCCIIPLYLSSLHKLPHPVTAKFSAALASIGVVAASLYSVFYDDETPAAPPESLPERSRRKNEAANNRLRSAIATAAPYLVLIALLVLEALAVGSILSREALAFGVTDGTKSLEFDSLTAVACAIGALVIGGFMDVNRLSMKNFYRSRLTVAYLQGEPVLLSDVKDSCNPNIIRPYPIINCAMNVTSPKDLSLQSIRSRNFIFSPLFCGFYTHAVPRGTKRPRGLTRKAYRLTTDYLNQLPPRVRLRERKSTKPGIRLNDPMTISGAAVNPTMGFHTSAALSFLLAMFNVRLGAWVGNPRHNKTYNKTASIGAPGLLIADFLGRTGDESKYLMLSDGGHFENTAAYELIRRECRLIFCCDSGCDADYTFGDLLRLVERCQIDFGVTITFPHLYHLKPFGRHRYARSNYTIGTIRYANSSAGYLVVFKPTVTRNASETIKSFDRDNSSFPQASTANQWFFESEFEAYRLLGVEAVNALLNELHLCQESRETRNRFSDQVFKKIVDLAPEVRQ